MTQLPSDTIYKDLRQKGLQLSTSSKIIVPEPQPPKTGLVTKLSSFMGRKKQQPIESQMKIIQAMHNSFLVLKKRGLFIYKYYYDQQKKQIEIKPMGNIYLTFDVIQIYTCDAKYLQDRDFPILLQSKDGISYYNFDMKQYVLTQRNTIKLLNVSGLGWITDKQCIILDDKNMHHYTIVQQVLKLKSTIPSQLIVGKQYIIKRMWILANIDEQQDSIITIFYGTILRIPDPNVKYPHMSLKIKQFIRTPDGDIINAVKSDYVLETKSLDYRDNFNIISVGEYYCLQLASEILIMKKKYEKYMLLDNMVLIMNGFEVKLNKKGLVVSIGQKLLQLNCIHFADPKCTSRICDVIQFPPELTGYNVHFKQIWPIISQKQYTLIFVFVKEQQSQITLSGLIKKQPMTKMMELASKKPKQKLQIIQDMALNLGIARKDFYLKLWKTSKKQNAHIYQYLIPCKDVNSIKKQLNIVLRTRTIQVSQMLKILQKMQGINLQNIKKDLNRTHLKQYVKNDFLKKKMLLNKMDTLLDHRIFQTIYNSSLQTIFFDIVSEQLDPVQPKFDPLHSSTSPQPYKQLKSLQNVLQTFKVVLLEDYKLFLRTFLAKFPRKILQVLNRFNFLLPNHPFQIQVQKPSKTNQPILKDPKTNDTVQQLWFQTVTVVQWHSGVTKQSVLKQLFYDYPTSKITQTIDQFYHSVYGKQNKGWKHGLVILNLDQYAKKIKALNGIQLYLDVCQFANQLAVQNNSDPKISEKILQVLREKNKLTEPDINFCRLYANMHYFMLKNNIIPKNKLEISMLTSLKPESLVAIFFLENKQRKQHIFKDFQQLYEDKNEFKHVLQKFVQSQNCSRIQLQILINQIIAKGTQFQQKNQDLIQLLIQGICMKVQIRESLLILDCDEQDEQNSGCLIDEIQLSKNLALKVNRIKLLKRCKSIFKCFQLQKMTYKQLLDLQKDNQIFKLILTRYFQLRDKQDREQEFEVVIQQQVINLQNPRNLLTVLVYVQQMVYYSARSFEILLLFGLQLLLWKQFEIMRQLVNDDNALQTLGIDKIQYLQTLIIRGLQIIYLDPQIVYDDQTKQQIINIISIDQQMSALKVKEIAKLDLVDIFTGWGFEVHPSDIHTICQKWKLQSRDQFMVDLIDNYVAKLNFKTFHQIYRLLEITQKQTTQINHQNIEYVKFCDLYARKLLENKRYKQVIQIIVFLMNFPTTTKIDYAMLAQSYLQSIVQLFAQDQQKSRKFIQFFVQKYNTPQQYSIKQLLQSYFDETVLNLWQRNPIIRIQHKYNYKQSRIMMCEVSLDDLWAMAKNSTENPSQLYYNYFFLIMGLTDPQIGFGCTLGISYNLQKIAGLVIGDLDRMFQLNQNLWFVNFLFIQAIFLFDGMMGEAGASLHININLDKQRKSKFDMIVKQLRLRRAENQKNDKLLAIMTKLKSQIFSKSKVLAKQQRYKLKLKQIKDKQLQKNKQEISIQKQPIEQQVPKQQVFLNWRKVQQQKRAISNMSQYIMSQKDLIDQVYQINTDLKSPKIIEKPKQKKVNTFQNLFLPIKGMQKIQHLVGLIKDRRYEQIVTYPQNAVIQALQKVYSQDNQKQYTQIVDILDSINVGDADKKQVFRLAKLFLANLSNETKKTLFPIQFLMTPLKIADAQAHDKYALIYKQLRPRIKQILKNIHGVQLKELANLMSVILQSPQYSARVYYDTLLYLGQHAPFDSISVLTAQQCIDGMGDYPELVSKNYPQILDKMKYDKQMKPYVRENLSKLMIQKHYDDVAEEIKKYI